ncbi:hypothetical protein OCAE111667_02610 [Occultella aeris]|uniref:Uncharacterized protein n=1 Tax=Occultella aeris TaxID=2761496 RepID=A0A7M4DGF9_9MICO|nr:hypothetical protein HALOF300_01206 [Occultella aeris]
MDSFGDVGGEHVGLVPVLYGAASPIIGRKGAQRGGKPLSDEFLVGALDERTIVGQRR